MAPRPTEAFLVNKSVDVLEGGTPNIDFLQGHRKLQHVKLGASGA
jgi:hypothetical protein